nr:HTH domain-containing protein [Butyrivibrio sp. AC2005]
MKIDRLIGILSILLQKEITTAPELADHFEVSRRTINRDIEALCKAGILLSGTLNESSIFTLNEAA